MNYRTLPKTNLRVSEISFGCMSLDLKSSDNEFLLKEALQYGINYFDTADLYDQGANEVLLGSSLKNDREQVIIATKVGNEWLPDGSWQWNPTKPYILKAVDQSLRRLQTDYIDIYQLHGGTMDDNTDEVIETFEYLIKIGKIRHYGISSIRPNVINSYAENSNIVSNMLQYSLLDRRPEEEVLQLLNDHQIGVMVRGSLAKGLLANKAATPYLNHDHESIHTLQQTLRIISNDQRSPAQSALKYILQNPPVTSAVVGIRTLEQLKEAVGTPNAKNLTSEEYAQLQKSIAPIKYEQHRI